jgi:hypothetical protein
LQQFHILAAKGHLFLRAVIDNVCNNIELYNPIIHGCGGLSVMMLSGPIAYTNVITPIMDKYPPIDYPLIMKNWACILPV